MRARFLNEAARFEAGLGFIELFAQRVAAPPFRITFWDGSHRDIGSGKPTFSLRLRNRTAVAQLFTLPTPLTAGRSITRGNAVISGDLIAALRTAGQMAGSITTGEFLQLAISFKHLPLWRAFGICYVLVRALGPSVGMLNRGVQKHYNRNPEFYRLWLGPTMSYTCGRFSDPDATLFEGQIEKFDLICEALDLCQDDYLLDHGSGWGVFGIYAAKHYGCKVTGITQCDEQNDFAEALAIAEGVDHLCSFVTKDYRRLEAKPTYTKIASIESIEALSQRELRRHARLLERCLKPRGLMYFQFVGRGSNKRRGPLSLWPTLLEIDIFPHQLPLTADLVRQAWNPGKWQISELVDRNHDYSRTLLHWLEGLTENREQLEKITGSTQDFLEFQLYVAQAAISFHEGHLALHSFLISEAAQEPRLFSLPEAPRPVAELAFNV